MFRKAMFTVAVATAVSVGLMAPANASSDALSSTAKVSGTVSADVAATPEKANAGRLFWRLEQPTCGNAGGQFGYGGVGARGYSEEQGATNVTALVITHQAQQQFRRSNGSLFWKTIATKTATYDFRNHANNLSHFFRAPANGITAYSFNANQAANNYIFRMNIRYVFKNYNSVLTTKNLATARCVA